MPGEALLLLVVAVLVLIPTRRLFVAGFPTPVLTAYYLIVVALGLLVAELRGPARYLVPILVVAYLAPFVAARAGIARMRAGRGDGRGTHGPTVVNATSRPMKNVTPREAQPPDGRN